MSLSRLYKYKELYTTPLPFITFFSTFIGFNAGFEVNNRLMSDRKSMDIYSNVIGFTAIGIITGVTYPISFPLFGYYVLHKNKK
jgi:hypothetical protein